MRLTINFILILIISSVAKMQACGPYYPYGEATRYMIMDPSSFDFWEFEGFQYEAKRLSSMSDAALKKSREANIELWRTRCKGVPSFEATAKAVYSINILNEELASENAFYQYLKEQGDTEAIRYLNFAKKAALYNAFHSDPWERNTTSNLPKRKALMNEAVNYGLKLDDEDLRVRYAFIAIRLAYYNEEYDLIKEIHEAVFYNRTQKNILDHWALYFRTMVEPQGPYKNYLTAQVFQQAPDKRFNMYMQYDLFASIDEELYYAKDNDAKAAISLIRASQEPGKALPYLKTIYALQPNSKNLDFLLLRELNKLEDWIYTTYYSRFDPAIIDWKILQENKNLNKRIQSDRAYARDFYDFVAQADLNKVQNKLLWKITKAYLLAMSEDYQTALDQIASLEKDPAIRPDISDKINQIKALCYVSMQKAGEAVIPSMVKAVLLYQHRKNNYQFVFSIARELEFKGNSTTAALLLSTINRKENQWSSHVFWRSKSDIQTLQLDYYDSYFFYLDAEYSTNQVEALIRTAASNTPKDEFNVWLYQYVKQDLNRLRDLLGTKFIRNNQLQQALVAFNTVDKKLYQSEPFSTYLDANPFYNNFYNEHEATKADTIRYDKASLTKQLIEYIQLAEDPSSGKSDYYNFLIGNCYLNMTQYGNSWMMRRYYWSNYIQPTGLEDDKEYFGCVSARDYYLRAKATTQSDKFAALCLRMAARCEEYNLIQVYRKNRYDDDYFDNIYGKNSYTKELKKDFPEDYETMKGNCLSFETYFNARN